jgi:transcriptional regulator with XRE-family HTH domain
MSNSLRKGKLMSVEINGPHPIDIYVGARVRLRRKEMGISQEALANALGLTFQQVQKYERGANRISASKLWEMSQTLGVPVASFFEGVPNTATGEDFVESQSEQTVNEFLVTGEGVELAAAFPKVRSAKLRRKILDLVRTLSETEAETETKTRLEA